MKLWKLFTGAGTPGDRESLFADHRPQSVLDGAQALLTPSGPGRNYSRQRPERVAPSGSEGRARQGARRFAGIPGGGPGGTLDAG